MRERVRRCLEESRRSALVLGPRQVGKSTLLRSHRPDLTINLASAASPVEVLPLQESLESLPG